MFIYAGTVFLEVNFLRIPKILTRKSEALTQFAYAGFLYVMLLALSSHLHLQDGMAPLAIVALILLAISYVSGNKIASGIPGNPPPVPISKTFDFGLNSITFAIPNECNT